MQFWRSKSCAEICLVVYDIIWFLCENHRFLLRCEQKPGKAWGIQLWIACCSQSHGSEAAESTAAAPTTSGFHHKRYIICFLLCILYSLPAKPCESSYSYRWQEKFLSLLKLLHYAFIFSKFLQIWMHWHSKSENDFPEWSFWR